MDMTQDPSIYLQFPNARSAYEAFDTLQELGYRPEVMEVGDCTELAIHVERADLQSALEISQAHGGQLMERQDPHHSAADGFNFDSISIPAHTMTEDFTDEYANGVSEHVLGDEYDALEQGYRDSL